MRPLISSLLLSLLACTAAAQMVGIEELDSTDFPHVSAILYAYDGTALVAVMLVR